MTKMICLGSVNSIGGLVRPLLKDREILILENLESIELKINYHIVGQIQVEDLQDMQNKIIDYLLTSPIGCLPQIYNDWNSKFGN